MSDWIDISDDAAFTRLVLDSPTPVVVAFENDDCVSCAEHRVRLSAASRLLGRQRRQVRIDVDRLPELAGRFRIVGFPTIALFSEGQLIARYLGRRNPASLHRRIAGLLDEVQDRNPRPGATRSWPGADGTEGAA